MIIVYAGKKCRKIVPSALYRMNSMYEYGGPTWCETAQSRRRYVWCGPAAGGAWSHIRCVCVCVVPRVCIRDLSTCGVKAPAFRHRAQGS